MASASMSYLLLCTIQVLTSAIKGSPFRNVCFMNEYIHLISGPMLHNAGLWSQIMLWHGVRVLPCLLPSFLPSFLPRFQTVQWMHVGILLWHMHTLGVIHTTSVVILIVAEHNTFLCERFPQAMMLHVTDLSLIVSADSRVHGQTRVPHHSFFPNRMCIQWNAKYS